MDRVAEEGEGVEILVDAAAVVCFRCGWGGFIVRHHGDAAVDVERAVGWVGFVEGFV